VRIAGARAHAKMGRRAALHAAHANAAGGSRVERAALRRSRLASKRRQLTEDLVGEAENVALQSAKRMAYGPHHALGRPWMKTDVNQEVKLLKTLASGADLSPDDLNVLAAMSIRHHETTKRSALLPPDFSTVRS